MLGKHILGSASKVMVPERARPPTVAVPLRNLPPLCECSPLQLLRRIALGMMAVRRSALSAWRSTRLANRWSDWNVSASSIKGALLNGSSGKKSARYIKCPERFVYALLFWIFTLSSCLVSPYFYALVDPSLLIILSWQYGVGCGFLAQAPCWISLSQPFERAFVSISLAGNLQMAFYSTMTCVLPLLLSQIFISISNGCVDTARSPQPIPGRSAHFKQWILHTQGCHPGA